MSECTLRIERNKMYADEMYSFNVWDGTSYRPLGLRKAAELLTRLEELTFLDGSTAEQVCDAARLTGIATAQIDWPKVGHIPCPFCHGKGQRADGDLCQECKGTGRIPIHHEDEEPKS